MLRKEEDKRRRAGAGTLAAGGPTCAASEASNGSSKGTTGLYKPGRPGDDILAGGAVPGADDSTSSGSSTDAIIEELKALAKSMLDSTNAARRRAHTLESRRSYEALMHAIDNRAPASIADTSVGTTVTTPTTTPATSAAARGAAYEDDGAAPLPSSLSRHADPAAAEELTEIPAFLGPAGGTTGGKEKVTASSERDGPRLRPSDPLTSGDVTVNAEEDDDASIVDGVCTRVFFRTTDSAAHDEVAGSVWKPEQLLRAADGTTVPDDADDSDGSGDDGSSSESTSSSSEGAVVHVGSRNNPAVAKKKPRRVFRVPLFPFGGGVTESEAAMLSRLFTRTIRESCRAGASPLTTPQLITKEEFDTYTYGEVGEDVAARLEAFQPKSPYEFVVEVERPVLFNAVRAREERRRAFRQLMKKGEAPVTMGTFNLRVIMDPTKTGFEDDKNFPVVRGRIIADRYEIVQLLGKATFSRAVRCNDLNQPIYADSDDDEENSNNSKGDDDAGKGTASAAGASDENGKEGAVATGKGAGHKKRRKIIGYEEVCLKIINNTKDFFDQSLDEIRLLTLINSHKDPDEAHVIRLIDAFYYKEHTMLVTELLSDNLYEYSKYNREEEEFPYFTLPRLRRIARQVTEALAYVHSLNLIHADLKPENILFVSHSRCLVKVIDFGSSCFLSDHLSSYIQSRSYRAPEVVLGCDYDGRIDVWSLGAILAELVTGHVLFTSETVPEMLARIVYVCGRPFPRRVLWEGRHTSGFINKFGLIYEASSSGRDDRGGGADDDSAAEDPYYVYTPVHGIPAAAHGSSKAAQQQHRTKDDAAAVTEKGKDASNGAGAGEKAREPYGVLRHLLAAGGVEDEELFSFIKACLELDHKKRPTTAELLSHPFIANERI